MVDIVSRATRSQMMAANRRRDTKPEMMVRRDLHKYGYRFRLDVRKLPGSPDIVLPRHSVAILVHGCFWHQHAGCPLASIPKTRTEFWKKKFRRNAERDKKAVDSLLALGWRVGIVWECGLEAGKRERTLSILREWISAPNVLGSNFIALPDTD